MATITNPRGGSTTTYGIDPTKLSVPYPPKGTQLTAKRYGIKLYYEPSVNEAVFAGYADDDKETKPWESGNIVGTATGKSIENTYGIWVEVTVRYWRKRLLDKVRDDATAYYLLNDDPVKWEGYEAQKEAVLKVNSVATPQPKGSSNTLVYFGIGLFGLLLLRGRSGKEK